MSDIFQTDEYVVNDNPYLDQGSGGGGADLDSLATSTNAIADADLVVSKEGDTWYKKSASKIWDYIKSKIKSVLHVDTGTIADIVNVYGAKNLIPYPFPALYFAGGVKTSNGITFTDMGDGTVKVNGTATGTAILQFALTNYGLPIEGGKKYTLSGCPSGGSASTYKMDARKEANGTTVIAEDIGEGVTFIAPSYSDGYIQIIIRIGTGTTMTNAIFKPMLRLASIQDDTYVPYVPTNKELLSCKLNGIMGAKNLLPYPYYETTKTSNGITFTDNGDGTIKVNGTSTGSTNFSLSPETYSNSIILPVGTYILTGCPSTGSGSTYRLRVVSNTNGTRDMVGADTGQGFIFSVTNSTVRYEIKLDVTSSGVSVNNLVFKPMIRRVEDTDPTWQPYAKTNRELTAVFTSSDTTDANATSWTSVTKLDSRESYSSIFAKMSQMFKNIRYLYKMLGTTDISQIGNGTATGAISSLNSALTTLRYTITNSSNKTNKQMLQSLYDAIKAYDVDVYAKMKILIDYGSSYVDIHTIEFAANSHIDAKSVRYASNVNAVIITMLQMDSIHGMKYTSYNSQNNTVTDESNNVDMQNIKVYF